MANRIDYTFNAQERLKLALDSRLTDEEASTIAQIALAEATLALVEQQRTANLLAALTLTPSRLADETIKTDASEITRTRIALRNAIRAEVRDGLRL